jgi:hypothetical protein
LSRLADARWASAARTFFFEKKNQKTFEFLQCDAEAAYDIMMKIWLLRIKLRGRKMVG